MFDKTSTVAVPWHPIAADSKWHARVESLEIITAALKAELTLPPPPVDPKVIETAAELLGIHVSGHEEEAMKGVGPQWLRSTVCVAIGRSISGWMMWASDFSNWAGRALVNL